MGQQQDQERAAMIPFAALSREIHSDNIEAGWWSDLATGESILATRNRPEMLMLAVSEVAEAYEGVAADLNDDKLPHLSMFDVELGDFAIRQFDQLGAEVSLGADMPDFAAVEIAPLAFTKPEQLLALVSDMAAAMEHYRKGRVQAYVEQMGQGLVHVFAIARSHGIDLLDVIAQKRAFNAKRADHKLDARKADGGKAF